MKDTIGFRECTRDDLPAFVEMSRALYDEDPASSGTEITPEKIHRTREEFQTHPEKGRVIVFEQDGRIAGYAILVFFWSNEYGGNIIEIDELFVRTDFRSAGIATAFFRWLEKTGGGAKEVVAFSLQVTPENHRARSLYTRLGFKPFVNQHLIHSVPGETVP